MAVYKPTDELKISKSKYDKLKEDYLKIQKLLIHFMLNSIKNILWIKKHLLKLLTKLE